MDEVAFRFRKVPERLQRQRKLPLRRGVALIEREARPVFRHGGIQVTAGSGFMAAVEMPPRARAAHAPVDRGERRRARG